MRLPPGKRTFCLRLQPGMHHEILAPLCCKLRPWFYCPLLQPAHAGDHERHHVGLEASSYPGYAVPWLNRFNMLEQDRPGINPRIHDVRCQSNTRSGSFEQRPLDHIHAPVVRQEA